MNARSILNKIYEFQYYIGTNDMDICAITETWLNKDDDMALKTIPPPGYDIMSSPRLEEGMVVDLPWSLHKI